MKTPVSLLQEFAVKQKFSMPDYLCEEGGFPEAFKYTVKVGNVIASGCASNKQTAKHKCAQNALELFGIKSSFQDGNNNPSSPRHDNGPPKAPVNYVGLLNETASVNKQSYPVYNEKFSVAGMFKISCSFLKWNTEGVGMNKKEAKQEAAREMFEIVKQNDHFLKEHSSQIALPVEKQGLLDELTKKALKKVEQLSVSPTQSSGVFEDVIPRIIASYPIKTLDELRVELERNGYVSIVATIQRNPYIVTLKIKGHSCILMGQGRTEKDAFIDLFQTTLIMFVKGYSFRNHFENSKIKLRKTE